MTDKELHEILMKLSRTKRTVLESVGAGFLISKQQRKSCESLMCKDLICYSSLMITDITASPTGCCFQLSLTPLGTAVLEYYKRKMIAS